MDSMQGPEYKRCKRCGETKALDQFEKHPQCRQGVRSECKACTSAFNKAYRERNAEKIAVQRAAKYERERERRRASAQMPCMHCGEPIPVLQRKRMCDGCRAAVEAARVERARRRVNEWYADPTNAARQQTYRRERRSNDPEWAAAQAERERQWREANPERHAANRRRNVLRWRARKAAAFVEDVDALVLLERHDGVCGICGGDVDPMRFDVDHVVPLSRGGEHSYANTQPAHPVCNYRKNNRLQEELVA